MRGMEAYRALFGLTEPWTADEIARQSRALRLVRPEMASRMIQEDP